MSAADTANTGDSANSGTFRNTAGITVLYEDNHLLVVEKPVNVLSQADSTRDPDMLTLLKQDIKVRFNKPGEVYLGLVHRLDRPVGGVMVFARTSKAASRISEQIRIGQFKKTYLAVLHGSPEEKQGNLRHYLKKNEASNMVRVVPEGAEGGKLASLDYKILAASGELSLAGIDLHTGRSHQIRVQFSHMGHPLYGDIRYAPGLNKIGQQLALWSYRLSFTHPTRGIPLTFTSLPSRSFPWELFSFDKRFFPEASSLEM